MNLDEAYKTLGVSENSSEEEVKKAFKTLSFQHHPDRGGNAEKFKEINEAYNTIKNPPPPQQEFFGRPFVSNDFNEIFNTFGFGFPGANFVFNLSPDINLNIQLSYKEFVLGTSKNISYKRLDKNKKEELVNLDVKIPAFTSKFRLAGKGHYIYGQKPKLKDGWTDAYVNVIINDDRFIVNGNVLTINQNISLKDAVNGMSMELDLYFIKINVSVPEMTKHKDVIQFNLNNSFFRVVNIIWNVEYPSNIKELLC
jgi:DnaJ-class molecular chaperone